MSTPAATARYVIAADDKTKAAIASINSNFRNMERGVKGTVTRINAAFGLLAGGAAARALKSVFTETAKGSKEFATALDDVRDSARNLLIPNEGLPGATAAMQAFAEKLKDPAVLEAANAITSALIVGFTKVGTLVFEVAAGLGVVFGMIGGEVEKINRLIDDLDRRIALAKSRRLPTDALEAEKGRLAKRQMELIEGPRNERFTGARFNLDPEGFKLPKFKVPDLQIDTGGELREFNDLEEVAAWRVQLQRMGEIRADLFEVLDEGIEEGVVDTAERGRESVQQLAEAFESGMEKAKASAVFVEEMQRSMFSNISDLFASAGDGADEFGDRTINAFKKLLADKATLELFKGLGKLGGSLTKSSGGEGWAGFFGSALTGLFGATSADTGIKRVPRDNQPFLLHEDEAVLPAAMNPWAGGRRAGMAGGAGGGINFAPVYNIDARGATQDVIKVLPQMMQQTHDRAVATMRDMQRRGKMR